MAGDLVVLKSVELITFKTVVCDVTVFVFTLQVINMDLIKNAENNFVDLNCF